VQEENRWAVGPSDVEEEPSACGEMLAKRVKGEGVSEFRPQWSGREPGEITAPVNISNEPSLHPWLSDH
jgi:hypothetical protein